MKVLVLGLGNTLLSDDGAGVHAVRLLQERLDAQTGASGLICRDGGTIGLALLGEIEDAGALIAVDAARFDAPPGAIRIFDGEEFDARVRSARASAHDLAFAELIDAARLAEVLPARRVLIGVEPASLDWGLSPTAPVAAALTEVVAAVRECAARWRELPDPEIPA